MTKKHLVRAAMVLVLIVFAIIFFPAWGMSCIWFSHLSRGNLFQAAPLAVLDGDAWICIFPLAVFGLFAALLPLLVLRCGAAVGIICSTIIFLYFLLPHAWKTDQGWDMFYQSQWDTAQKSADGGNSYEHIVHDPKAQNRIVFYIKGFGVSKNDVLFTLFSLIPASVFMGEIYLRKQRIGTEGGDEKI